MFGDPRSPLGQTSENATEAATAAERRVLLRDAIPGDAIQTRIHRPGGGVLKGVLTDISPTGAGIAGDPGDLTVGDTIVIQLLYATGTPQTRRGTVCHVEPGVHFGVSFVDETCSA